MRPTKQPMVLSFLALDRLDLFLTFNLLALVKEFCNGWAHKLHRHVAESFVPALQVVRVLITCPRHVAVHLQHRVDVAELRGVAAFVPRSSSLLLGHSPAFLRSIWPLTGLSSSGASISSSP